MNADAVRVAISELEGRLIDTTDPAAALELVSVLKAEGWWFECWNVIGGWSTHFYKCVEGGRKVVLDAIADSLPRAIALAFLKVRGKEVI